VRALLLGNSGRPYLTHAMTELLDFLGPARRLGFVTAASLGDEEAYYETPRSALGPAIALEHMRWDRDPFPVLARADAVFVGGGNTYALLRRLRQSGLLEPLRERVRGASPTSAPVPGQTWPGPTSLRPTTGTWWA